MGQTTKFIDSRQESAGSSDEKSVIHHVPFRIEYEGKAEVMNKFVSKAYEDQDKKDILRNEFRGKPLMGQVKDVPKNFEGLIMTDFATQKTESDDSSLVKSLHIVKDFESYTYWNFDKLPSSMDIQNKLDDWLDLSQILHEPITN